MPGPSRWRGEAAFLAAATDKLLPTALDDRTRAVLQLVKDCQQSGVGEDAEEGTRNTPETAAALRRLAADAIVLLKNEKSILPLEKDKKVSPGCIPYYLCRGQLLIIEDARHRSECCVPSVLRWRLGGVESVLCGNTSASDRGQIVSRERQIHHRCPFPRRTARPGTNASTSANI